MADAVSRIPGTVLYDITEWQARNTGTRGYEARARLLSHPRIYPLRRCCSGHWPDGDTCEFCTLCVPQAFELSKPSVAVIGGDAT